MGLRKFTPVASKPRIAPSTQPVETPSPDSAPADAPSIFLGPSGRLCIFFPPSPEGLAGHTVSIDSSDPATMGKLLLRILAERAVAPRAKLNSSLGVPTQALLDALAKPSPVKVFRPILLPDYLTDDDLLD